MAKVLVVEDEEHIQRLIEVIIKKQGHEVVKAFNGESALEMLKGELAGEKRPQLILLDIMMTGIDGLQVLKVLRAANDLKDIPVVMLSALTQENVVLQGLKLGAKGYVKKPFHPKDLVARISKFLV